MALPQPLRGKVFSEGPRVIRQPMDLTTSALPQPRPGSLAFGREELGRRFAHDGYGSVRRGPGPVPIAEVQVRRTGLTKTQPEEVLDWLEAHGHGDGQLSIAGDHFALTT